MILPLLHRSIHLFNKILEENIVHRICRSDIALRTNSLFKESRSKKFIKLLNNSCLDCKIIRGDCMPGR